MDEVSNGPPEERDEDDTSSTSTAEAPLPSSMHIPTSFGDRSPETPVANMEIELVRIQADMYSPVIILQNLNNLLEVADPTESLESRNATDNEEQDPVPPVPETSSSPEPTAEANDTAEPQQSVARDTISSNRMPTPGSTPRRKKRRRTASPKALLPKTPEKLQHDEEGLTCSICLDEWTMTGDHRVVSLKCGHLFGLSCITRWLQDNPAASRCCATCKARAKRSDIRYIYAHAVKAIDNTLETALKEELALEKKKVLDLTLKLNITYEDLNEMRRQIDRIKKKMATTNDPTMVEEGQNLVRRFNYQLTLEKNIEISREPGCRALAYSTKHSMLLISQKSNQPLFPGYALRLLQVPEVCGKSTNALIHISAKSVRDIALDKTSDLFACATMEKLVKVFSLTTRTVQCAIELIQNEVAWACAFDGADPRMLYIGTQRGTVYSYNIGQPGQIMGEYKVGHDLRDYTAVINICPVDPTSLIPGGGFLVCKLKSAWFYEFKGPGQAVGHHLNITGPFLSMSYNAESGLMLIVVRSTQTKPSTLVLAALERQEDSIFTLHVLHTYEGSRVQTNMQRSAQILLNNKADTLVATYKEDTKVLATWCTNSGDCWLQQVPLREAVMDICPVFGASGAPFFVALSDCRCRIYRIVEK